MKKSLFLLILVSLLSSCSDFVADNKFEVTGIVKSLNVSNTLRLDFTDGRHFYLKEMPNCQVDQGSEIRIFCHRLPAAYNYRVVIDSFAVIKPTPKTQPHP